MKSLNSHIKESLNSSIIKGPLLSHFTKLDDVSLFSQSVDELKVQLFCEKLQSIFKEGDVTLETSPADPDADFNIKFDDCIVIIKYDSNKSQFSFNIEDDNGKKIAKSSTFYTSFKKLKDDIQKEINNI